MVPRKHPRQIERRQRRRQTIMLVSAIAFIMLVAAIGTRTALSMRAGGMSADAAKGAEAPGDIPVAAGLAADTGAGAPGQSVSLAGTGQLPANGGAGTAEAPGKAGGSPTAADAGKSGGNAASEAAGNAGGNDAKPASGGSGSTAASTTAGAAGSQKTGVQLLKPTAPVVAYDPALEGKLVALTFDDGPDDKYTPAILDILKQYKVKATFFTVGLQVKKYPDMMKRIVKEGHELGNHTYHHSDLTKVGSDKMKNEILWTDTLIQRAVGFVPNLVRPPYGATNAELKSIVADNGRELALWSVDTRDWAGESVARIQANVNKNTHPGGVILMHSFGNSHIKNTVAALPGVIESLQKKGYKLVTFGELQAVKEHHRAVANK